MLDLRILFVLCVVLELEEMEDFSNEYLLYFFFMKVIELFVDVKVNCLLVLD